MKLLRVLNYLLEGYAAIVTYVATAGILATFAGVLLPLSSFSGAVIPLILLGVVATIILAYVRKRSKNSTLSRPL